MKRKSNFSDTGISAFLVYLFIFYLTYLLIDKFKLFDAQILIFAVVASIVTTYILHKQDEKQDPE